MALDIKFLDLFLFCHLGLLKSHQDVLSEEPAAMPTPSQVPLNCPTLKHPPKCPLQCPTPYPSPVSSCCGPTYGGCCLSHTEPVSSTSPGTRAPTAMNVSPQGAADAVMALGAAADLDQTTRNTEEGHWKNERTKDLLLPGFTLFSHIFPFWALIS